jgi:ubiquitin-conjugating enzyme E2 W
MVQSLACVVAILCIIIDANATNQAHKGFGSAVMRSLPRTSYSLLTSLRGGASARGKGTAKRKRARMETDSDSEGGEEWISEPAGRGVQPGYKPQQKGLVSTLFAVLFRLIFGILSPFLPQAIVSKMNKRKPAGAMATSSSRDSRGKTKQASRKGTSALASAVAASTATPPSSSMTQEHLERAFTKGDTNNRVQKELRAFLANPPENCRLVVGANIRVWVVHVTGAEGTIFAGEKYKLKLVFPKDYPAKPPSVYFLKPTPRHVHVYSNGDICLNLLGKDWRPTMSAQLLVLSIYSMLSSAKEKKIPQDNAMHADNAPGQQQEGWMYHDDRC